MDTAIAVSRITLLHICGKRITVTAITLKQIGGGVIR